jgi:hypothetical protein
MYCQFITADSKLVVSSTVFAENYHLFMTDNINHETENTIAFRWNPAKDYFLCLQVVWNASTITETEQIS